MSQQNVAQSASTSLQSSAIDALRNSQSGSLAPNLQTQTHHQSLGNRRLSSSLPTENPLVSPQVMPLEAAFAAATQPNPTTLTQSLQSRAPSWLKQGLQGVQQWLGTGREAPVSPLPQTQGPLIGIIDTGFAPGQHGHQMLQTIQSVNPDATILLAGGVGRGTWADSLTKFVDTAKATGQTRAVVNASFDLTQKNPDGSITTRQELTAQEKAALNYARENGVLVVASAGNEDGAMSALGQASGLSDNLIVVGSAEGNDRAAYSSYGKGLDFLFANSPDSSAGTSASAAKTTQTIAQIWAANPKLTPQQVIQTLEATAIDLQKPGWDATSGLGIVNTEGALYYAATVTPAPQWMAKMGFTQPFNALGTPTWNGSGGTVATERANGWPSLRSIGHGLLDAAGFIPVVGAVADVANAAWYAAEGDYVNAGFSAAAALPGIGDAAAAARLGVRGVRAATGGARAAQPARAAAPQPRPRPRPRSAGSGGPVRRPTPPSRPRPSGSGAAPRRPQPGGAAGRGRTTTAAPSPRRTPQRTLGQGTQPRRPVLSPSRRPARTPQARTNPGRTPQSPSLRANQPQHRADLRSTRPQPRASQGRANLRHPTAPATSRRPASAGRSGQYHPQQSTARTPENNSRTVNTQELTMEAASYPLQEVLAASSAEPRSEWAQRLSTGAEFALSLSSRGQRPRGGSSTGLGVTNSSRDGTTPSPRPRSAANSNGGAGPLRPGQAGPPGNGRTPPPTSRGGGIPHLVHGGNPQLVHLGSSPGQGRRRRPMFYLDSTSMSGGQLRRTWGNRRARVLEANMRANGVRPPGVALPRGTTWTAHHIVPGTQNMVVVSGPRILGPTKFQSFDPNIISARTHLVNLGISAGDASNGVFLPHVRRRGAANAANRTPPNNMPLHNQIHTPRYFQEVWNRLQGTTTPQQARQALAQISSDLQRGQFPF